MDERTSEIESVGAASAGDGGTGMSAGDLAELLGAFNEASKRLQESHEELRAEVVRLKGELKLANDELERGRRLAALGEMAAGIAHEVRNPLGSIRLYAKMLVDDLADRAGERAVAEKIGVAVRGLDAVVGDVLAFAREMAVREAECDGWEMMDAAVEEAIGGDRAWRERVRVLRSAGGEGVEAMCDAALVHRALVNVVRNGVEAIVECERGEGTLSVGVERRDVRDADGTSREWCVLSVRDTGGGVPAEAMERIFNPFFTTRATGTGLGLGIVHRIMDAHAGRTVMRNVEGDGELGRGALVELMLPPVGAARGEAKGERGGEGTICELKARGAASASGLAGVGGVGVGRVLVGS